MNTTNADYYTFNTGNSLLLLGGTGSGKSVLCEALFKRYIQAKKPADLRFIILDMTGVDAEILRDKHPEYIEELVDFDADKALEVLERCAEQAKAGRPDEKSQLFIFIEECNLARVNQERFEELISEITSHAASANIKLIYSTSVITPQTASEKLIEAFDVVLVGHQYSSEARQYLGVPDTDDFPAYSFIVKEKEAATA